VWGAQRCDVHGWGGECNGHILNLKIFWGECLKVKKERNVACFFHLPSPPHHNPKQGNEMRKIKEERETGKCGGGYERDQREEAQGDMGAMLTML